MTLLGLGVEGCQVPAARAFVSGAFDRRTNLIDNQKRHYPINRLTINNRLFLSTLSSINFTETEAKKYTSFFKTLYSNEITII